MNELCPCASKDCSGDRHACDECKNFQEGNMKGKLFVAVVADHQASKSLIKSAFGDGRYTAYIGNDKQRVVDQAFKSSKFYANSRADDKPYRILVGELTGEARILEQPFEVIPL